MFLPALIPHVLPNKSVPLAFAVVLLARKLVACVCVEASLVSLFPTGGIRQNNNSDLQSDLLNWGIDDCVMAFLTTTVHGWNVVCSFAWSGGVPVGVFQWCGRGRNWGAFMGERRAVFF